VYPAKSADGQLGETGAQVGAHAPGGAVAGSHAPVDEVAGPVGAAHVQVVVWVCDHEPLVGGAHVCVRVLVVGGGAMHCGAHVLRSLRVLPVSVHGEYGPMGPMGAGHAAVWICSFSHVCEPICVGGHAANAATH
jgi:hypothetical protein